MRRRVVIEWDTVGRGTERNIVDKIAYQALKAIRSGGGNQVSIYEEEVEHDELGVFEVMRR